MEGYVKFIPGPESGQSFFCPLGGTGNRPRPTRRTFRQLPFLSTDCRHDLESSPSSLSRFPSGSIRFPQGFRPLLLVGHGRPSGSESGGCFQGSVRENRSRARVLRFGVKSAASMPKNLNSSTATRGPQSNIVSHPDLKSGSCTFTLRASSFRDSIGGGRRGFRHQGN